VSIIFVFLGLYAISGTGIIRKFPFLKVVIYAVAILCIIRGTLPIQLWLRHPEKVNDVAFIPVLYGSLQGCCIYFAIECALRSF
jgi:hypothetical protein